VDHADSGVTGQTQGHGFKAAKEKVGCHFQAFYLTTSHVVLKLFGEGGSLSIPETPKAIVTASEDFDGPLRFPDADGRHRGMF
jgi:hypothetical protein